MMMKAFYALLALSWVGIVIWTARRCIATLHLLQLDSYNNQRLMKWLNTQRTKRLLDLPLLLVSLALAAVALVGWIADVPWIFLFVPLVWITLSVALFFLRKPGPSKKPLVWTGRAKRIFVVAAILSLSAIALLMFATAWFSGESDLEAQARWTLVLTILGGFVLQGAWVSIILANIFLTPVQARVNNFHIGEARKRLKDVNPIVIGVAGSYGKTSTKFILETILVRRFQVLKTPQSFNNILGISRVINSDLRPEHEVFIVELGGYQRGHIRRSTNLVEPKISILTAIGPEHLERLKTMDNVEAMNYEAIEAVPPSGLAVFNNDMEGSRRLADRTKHTKVLRFGLDQTAGNLFLTAEDISMSSEGLSFTIVNQNGERLATKTQLLGRHNVLNILGAACVALEMGMSLQEVAAAIPRIQPVPHRLQIIRGDGGVTVIDDAYNSNPVGAMEALNVLNEFREGRRILITPGMVELGTLESRENEELGAKAATVCDYVVLVGFKQTQDILRGLQRESFPQDKIIHVADLTEATETLRQIVRPRDVVLFENDLPDLYSDT